MRSKNFIERIIHNPIIQTLVIFISGGWIVLEITEYFIENFGLNESARNILLKVMLVLLPVAVFFAWYISRKQKEKGKSSSIPDTKKSRVLLSWKRPQILFPIFLIILAIGITFGFRKIHQSKLQSALNSILPTLTYELTQIDDTDGEWNWNAYNQALEIKRILRNNPDFTRLWNELTIPLTIKTNPTNARVFAKPYSKPDTSWLFLGETPLHEFPFPKGLSRIKIEKSDFETQYDIILKPFGWELSVESRDYMLFKADEKPEEMVYVPGFMGDYFRTPALPTLYIGDYWIDRYEVTNRQYKTFMDSGGYTNPYFWQFPFIEGKDTLMFETAIEGFKDHIGWFGPANWEMGVFPEGEDEIPVTGISWYEASAYAKFRNKELPTLFHWVSLSDAHAAPEITKFGNFDKKAPVEKGTYPSMTRYGTLDLPGNVSEWIFNSSGPNRTIVGGNFLEPTYWYNRRLFVSPWTRSELIGFRCMQYINDTLKQELSQTFDRSERDFSKAKPVSDEVFGLIKEMYNYEKGGLNPVIISSIKEQDWIKETVSVEVPYEDTPLEILIFLPMNSTAPCQSIIFFPVGGARDESSMASIPPDNWIDFFLKSGRAVVWPVYYGTYGRGDIKPKNMHTWKQTHIYRLIDVQIVCDYLDVRKDMDSQKIAYYGVSWGGFMAPYILAIEDRIKLGILALFGAQSSEGQQDLDQINYLPRVKVPMLLMDGRYDFDFSLEEQQAFYDFLGTPESDKEWKLYESSHYVPRKDLINESLNWLDKYFGPVNK